ncbi:MAG: discoidin domain-containing protein [Planctomycetota bacterium]
MSKKLILGMLAMMALSVSRAQAGTFTVSPWTSDADSGISADKIYTHTGKFMGTEGEPFYAGNGVWFEGDRDNQGVDWKLSNIPHSFGSQHGTNVIGSGANLLTFFVYGDDPAGVVHPILELSNLTKGQKYILMLYAKGFEDSGRVVDITADDAPGSAIQIDQDKYGGGNGLLLKYAYTAPGSGKLTLTFDELGSNMSWHHYAFSNEKVRPYIFASLPDPANGATDGPRDDVVLSWMPGDYADKHDVYFGTSFDDVNSASPTEDPVGVYLGRQDPNTLALDRLELGQTYYWRIDDVNAAPDYTIFKGNVWSFTVEPIAYLLAEGHITATASSSNSEGEGPANTINGSGLNSDDLHSMETADMWLSSGTAELPTWIQYEFDKAYRLHQMLVWNHNSSLEPLVGFGLKDVTIEYSVNGTDYTTLSDTHEFARATGTPDYAHNTTIDFGGVSAKYIRLTANSNWGGILNQYGLSEVRFFFIPVQARKPSPDSGAIDVGLDPTLGWRAGREAAKHDVYFSDDRQAVIDGTAPVTTVTETSYGPLVLDLGKTYYWRVDEVNEAEIPATWQGDIWDFSTQEYLVVDDFEDYDTGENQIWYAWKDGLGYGTPSTEPYFAGNGTGSAVGDENTGSYTEETIVHKGRQAMPLFYDNNKQGFFKYSEVELTLSYPRDWTEKDVNTLTIWFRGNSDNAAEPMYVALNGNAVVAHDNPDAAQIVTWTQWNIDLQAFADQGVNLANVNTIALGLGDKSNPQAGGSGTMYFDDIGLYPSPPEPAPTVGTFSVHPWTGDGDSGISSSKTYTHTGKFTGEGTDGEPFFAGNGVYFERDTNRSGTNWTLTGAANVFDTTNPVTVAGDSAALARGFFYGDEDNNHPVLTLMGLVPNTEYVTTFYTVGFGGAGLRFVDITPGDNPSNPTRVDQNGAGSGNGQLIKYTYTATSTEMSFTFDAFKTADSWHHYAFSNELHNFLN